MLEVTIPKSAFSLGGALPYSLQKLGGDPLLLLSTRSQPQHYSRGGRTMFCSRKMYNRLQRTMVHLNFAGLGLSCAFFVR